MKSIVKAGLLMIGMLAALVACGGGGGSGTTGPTVSGTASEGALITGKTVKLKDVNGKSAVDSTTSATGNYSIDVTGLIAPFLVTVTGTKGTYLSLAPTAGTANINPITTTVVALAAGTSDVSALFANLTPVQLTTINANYIAKSALVTAVLPDGLKTENYFTGTMTAGNAMDTFFDKYHIVVEPTAGIITVTPTTVANAAPVANAGTAQNVLFGAIVALDGSGSSDANGDLLTYNWAITSKPSGSNATLSSTTAVKPTFTADVVGTYVLNLIVNDGQVNSAASTVTVTASVANAAPVANAGTAQNVFTGAVVTLNGSGSSDLNGDQLTYVWAFTSRPVGSNATLSITTAVKPTFTADIAGTYVLKLIVNDGKVDSAAASVTVAAITATKAVVAVAFNQTAINKINATPSPKLVTFGFHILNDIAVATVPVPIFSNSLPVSLNAQVNSTDYTISMISSAGETVSAGQNLYQLTYTLVSGVPQFSIDPARIEAGTYLTSNTSTPVTLVPADFKLTVTYQ